VSLAGLHAEVQQLRAMLQSSEPSA
jgi:hypothetical protein